MRERFEVGEVFSTMAALRLEVSRYFGQRNLGYRMPVNNTRQLKVQCTEHRDCPFLLWGFKVGGTEMARVTRFEDQHSLAYTVIGVDRQRAPQRVRTTLLTPIADAVLEMANVGVKSSQIRKKAKTDHRLDITNHQAWRAKSKAINQSIGDGRQSYKYMSDWLSKMKESNPGTVTRLEQVDGHFSRACIVHGIFNDAVKFALPVVALDACHLKTKYKGILYVASIITGNFDVLIAGMAISNAGAGENKDDWLFFLDALVEGLPWLLVLPSLVVVSDRDKGLLPAVSEKLQAAHHSYCSVHIKRNVVARFHTGLDGAVHNIARATLKADVEEILEALRKSNAPIAAYLEGIGNEHWMSAYFPVPRFGIVTSNAAESMNSSIADERLAAHLAIFIRITRKISIRLTTLHTRYQGLADTVVPRIDATLRKAVDSALRREVLPHTATEASRIFEVKRLSKQEYRVVDLAKRTCTCGVWEEMQYPCVHAHAAILHEKELVSSYVHAAFLVSSCKEAVSGTIVPVDVEVCDRDETSLPPIVQRRPGKQKTRRFPSAGEEEEKSSGIEQGDSAPTSKSAIRCSVCDLTGHNKRTCPQKNQERHPQHLDAAQDLTTWQFVESVWLLENMFDAYKE